MPIDRGGHRRTSLELTTGVAAITVGLITLVVV